MRARWGFLAILLGASCSVDVPQGVFACQRDDECPSGWSCRADGRCWSSPGPVAAQDASPGPADATPAGDATTHDDAAPMSDATSFDDATTSPDATTFPDATIGQDAVAADDAMTPSDATSPDADLDASIADADGGAPDAGGCIGAPPSCQCGAARCVSDLWACPDPINLGNACDTTNRCGARVDCNGACVGGVTAPSCPCGPPSCQANGQWGACPAPPNLGQTCFDPVSNFCGGRVECSGQCVGGLPAPTCACGPATCQATGQWSQCPGPMNVGELCVPTGGGACGSRVDCAGDCVGGTAPPRCPCGPATCQADGTWTDCNTPPDFGASCSTPQVCGGTIDCAGMCGGGAPPAPCLECGTPSCAGCVGGPACLTPTATCGLDGQCACTASQCSCNGPNQTCDVCIAGEIGTCVSDLYACGTFFPRMVCAFGCDMAQPDECACAPNMGDTCVHSTCSCFCGDFDREGTVQCNGSCGMPSISCGALCRRECRP